MKEFIKLYLRLVIVGIVLVTVLGLLCPYLISAASTESVLAGIGILIMVPVILLYFITVNVRKKNGGRGE